LILEIIFDFTLNSPIPSPGLIVLFYFLIALAVFVGLALFALCIYGLYKLEKKPRKISPSDSSLSSDSSLD
jgi:hypothetical protein